jgi:hypothetical protein
MTKREGKKDYFTLPQSLPSREGREKMMKRRINILAVLMLVLAMVAPLSTPLSAHAQDARTLTKMDFNIVGVTLSVGPEYQAVPKGITSVVTTGFVSNGSALPDNVLAMLPKDFKVIGEFSGPTYTTPLTLTHNAGQSLCPAFSADIGQIYTFQYQISGCFRQRSFCRDAAGGHGRIHFRSAYYQRHHETAYTGRIE